ncbi:HNH endonuclease signature motif containing protein [Paremcibacter congregatus]|uniref:HNH endonuclease signature motif containing protein n=1 Tax=Paremcibacter congregatus TaxID=2043170 RepID=UPI003A8D53D9
MAEVTQKHLKEIMNYNKSTGDFVWLKSRGRISKGQKAGCVGDKGYLLIRVDGALHRAHRLAWLFVTGKMPDRQIDHINGDKLDNRWGNLREADNGRNSANASVHSSNTSGYKGVSWRPDLGKYHAYGNKDGKRITLGFFSKAKDAAKAYDAHAKMEYGKFARTNRKLGLLTSG